jgi:hypothetical protein
MSTPQGEKARIIKANLMLQSKIGTGTIEDEKIKKMEKTMEEAKVDFGPMANIFLNELAVAISKARTMTDTTMNSTDAVIAAMTEPVMQIKANAAMFDYQLVGNLANIVLNFLENIEGIDKTVIEIVDAHQKTLSIIVKSKMMGTGGEYGLKIETELKDACKRYFNKRGTDAVFVE